MKVKKPMVNESLFAVNGYKYYDHMTNTFAVESFDVQKLKNIH